MQREGPFPEKRALFFFKQMVEAFKILSRTNIMHRDIKPDNFFIGGTETTKDNIFIIDFGLAKKNIKNNSHR